jgi:hypothetical protein
MLPRPKLKEKVQSEKLGIKLIDEGKAFCRTIVRNKSNNDCEI